MGISPFEIGPSHGKVSGHSRRCNIGQPEAIANCEFSRSYPSRNILQAAVDLAPLTCQPLRTLLLRHPVPLPEMQDKGITDAICQNFDLPSRKTPV
jgi:hypothetical protein